MAEQAYKNKNDAKELIKQGEYSIRDIKNMTLEDINKNWDKIKKIKLDTSKL